MCWQVCVCLGRHGAGHLLHLLHLRHDLLRLLHPYQTGGCVDVSVIKRSVESLVWSSLVMCELCKVFTVIKTRIYVCVGFNLSGREGSSVSSFLPQESVATEIQRSEIQRAERRAGTGEHRNTSTKV